MNNNTNTISSKKIKRKSFLFILTASVIGFYSLIKMPFRLFTQQKEESSSPNNSALKVSLNPNAVSRNPRGNNG